MKNRDVLETQIKQKAIDKYESEINNHKQEILDLEYKLLALQDSMITEPPFNPYRL